MTPPKSSTLSGLKWSGLLTKTELQSLREEYADLVICPGYTGRFGSKADDKGFLYIPGAAQGIYDSRRRFKGWRAKGESDPRFNWWEGAMKERNLEPITGDQLLQGLEIQRWKAYTVEYKKAVSTRLHRLARERRRQRAQDAYAAETADDENTPSSRDGANEAATSDAHGMPQPATVIAGER